MRVRRAASCFLLMPMLVACPSAPVIPCAADQHAGYFSLDDRTQKMLTDKEGYFTENPPTYTEDKANSCCSFWNDSVAGFCESRVKAYCDSNYCCSQKERDRCSTKEREKVKEICLSAALADYHRLLPSCNKLILDRQTTSWPNQQNKAVACPCSSSSCGF